MKYHDTKTLFERLRKIEFVINKCQTVEHLKGALNMVDSFYRIYKNDPSNIATVFNTYLSGYINQQVKKVREFDYTNTDKLVNEIFSNRINQ